MDNWAQSTFSNNGLKNINGYSSRLITASEYNNISVYSWKYVGYWYWTMTTFNNSRIEYYVLPNRLNMTGIENRYAVRPVINVKKEVIIQS